MVPGAALRRTWHLRIAECCDCGADELLAATPVTHALVGFALLLVALALPATGPVAEVTRLPLVRMSHVTILVALAIGIAGTLSILIHFETLIVTMLIAAVHYAVTDYALRWRSARWAAAFPFALTFALS